MLFSRACELFIADLTSAAHAAAQQDGERILDRNHVMRAIATDPRFDFLRMVMPANPAATTAAGAGAGAAGVGAGGMMGDGDDEDDE